MLRLAGHAVGRVTEGPETAYADGNLILDLGSLRSLVLEDPRLSDVDLQIVRPGDRTRVINVLDVFDARKKDEGPTYPGFDGPPLAAGEGRVSVLEGFQIVATGALPAGEGGLMVTRRALIDFWGEGARWSPFSGRHTLVLGVGLAEGLDDKAEADDAVRRALVKLSTALGAAAAAGGEGGDVVEIASPWERQAVPGLPGVAYVYQVQSQGALVDTFLYGTAVEGLYPTLLDAAEVLDGALVSGNHQRLPTPTYFHVNNPVLSRLVREHGKTLNLLPCVLMEGHQISTPAKERGADHAAQLLRYLGAAGAIFTQEGGGMSMVDQMLTIERARAAGIECVAVTFEMAGVDGADRPLIHYSRAADHLVSTGNRDELVVLEAPERLVGRVEGASKSGKSTETSENLDLAEPGPVPVWCLYGSISQVGGSRTRGVAA